MAFVITSPCIGVKDSACVNVCPVQCIYDAGQMLVVDPDECIDCGLCEPECPVHAILPMDEVPEEERAFIARNADWFKDKSKEQVEAKRCVPE